MTASPISLDPKIRFLISVPDWRPEEATPFQGFAFSLCQNSWLLRFIYQMPTDIFELTPNVFPHRIARRIAGQAPINWYGQSPNALKSFPFPVEAAFTFILLDTREKASAYDGWRASSPGPVTLIAKDDGDIRYSKLSFESVKARLLEICASLRVLGTVDKVDEAEAAIVSWVVEEDRQLPYDIGGHGTIFPNAAVLRVCGFAGVVEKPFARLQEGEQAHLEQIVLTTNTIFDEREANPFSVINRIYPRSPDLNLYCPATYDLKSAFSLRSELDRDTRREIEMALRLLDRQQSYSFDPSSAAQTKALLGDRIRAFDKDRNPTFSPIVDIRRRELWLGTEAVGCLAASEIGAVVRLPNRLNLARGAVRQFAEHYRAERPQILKRAKLFRGVQRAIAKGFPTELKALVDRSRDGIRIIADAHIEWLDVRGVPLGLRYNVSRIPVTPGNLFIEQLSSPLPIHSTPEDFRDILVVSGLAETDDIARQFNLAFDAFGEHWRNTLRVKFVRITSRQELIDVINAFDGMLMVFDGHGSHKADQPGVLWFGQEPIDVWSLREEIRRPPPIVILSACDTHAADRNHATVANGFLAIGSRSVLGSVFPLDASHAAIFAARLLFRVSDYIPAALEMFNRSLTWLEVVSGMLRRQVTTDILRHLEGIGLMERVDSLVRNTQIQGIVDSGVDDPMSALHRALLEYGVPEERLDKEIYNAISASSVISYLHLGRPETILINSAENLKKIVEATKPYSENE